MKFKIAVVERIEEKPLDNLEVVINSDVLDEIQDRVFAGSGIRVDHDTILTAIELVYRWDSYPKREIKHITKENEGIISSAVDAMAGIYEGMGW